MDEAIIIQEMADQYGEWLEMAGDKAPALMIHILAKKLLQERELNLCYKRRLNERDMSRRISL